MNMMKKLVAIMFVVSAMFLSSCGQPSEDDIFTIDERFFVLQMDEIFLNSSRFVGRTIRYEGFFGSMQIGDEPAFYYVARTTFGCCGADGLIGFEVVLGAIEPVADDAWVEVTGVLEMEGRRPFLSVISLTELAERGADFVE